MNLPKHELIWKARSDSIMKLYDFRIAFDIQLNPILIPNINFHRVLFKQMV